MSAPPPAPPPSDDGPPELVARVAALRPLLEQVRGHALGPVRVAASTREGLLRDTQAWLDAVLPPKRAAGLARLHAAIGWLDPDADLRGRILARTRLRVGDSYDPRTKTLFLHPDQDRSGIHELVHALQDQRFDLARLRAPFRDPSFDREDEALAFEALCEGEAAYLSGRAERGRFEPLQALRTRAAQRRYQPVLRVDSFTQPGKVHPFDRRWSAPYLEGELFVAAIVEAHGWDGLDALFAEPPTSSEQVLHPEKALGPDRDDPLRIELPDLSEPVGGALLAQETVGELGLRVMFFELSGDDARAACAGWGGDRAQAYDVGGETALVWRLSFDTSEDAVEFVRAFARARAKAHRRFRLLRTARVRRSERDVAVVGGVAAPDPVLRAVLGQR